MQLTRAADYAVRVMIQLAMMPDGTKVRMRALAHEIKVPGHFLAKLLQALTRAELVISHRGPDGGFELAPGARTVTMLDVIEAIEGPVELNVCLSKERCAHQDWCPAHLVWSEAQAAMLIVLRRATIHELAYAGARRKSMLHAVQQQ